VFHVQLHVCCPAALLPASLDHLRSHSPASAWVKDGVCGGGLVAREDGGSDSDDDPTEPRLPNSTLPPNIKLRPAAASGRLQKGGVEQSTPSKARPPVTQVLPASRSHSGRAHHPCAPWFRPDNLKKAIEPRPSRRSLSAALAEEPLLSDGGDGIPEHSTVSVHAPQVPLSAKHVSGQVSDAPGKVPRVTPADKVWDGSAKTLGPAKDRRSEHECAHQQSQHCCLLCMLDDVCLASAELSVCCSAGNYLDTSCSLAGAD
jgi:hypothetical protein